MIGGNVPRWTLVEYGEPTPLIREIAAKVGIERSAARALLETAGRRVARTLGFDASPIQIVGDDVRAVDFAGMLALGPRMEIEVAPKFLGPSEGWQEDFFLLALLSQHGHLLDEGLSASSSSKTDLPTLIGRALASLYWKNRRRPIRVYRREQFQGFEIEGDFDPVDLIVPDEEGYSQIVTGLTRRNEFNDAVRRAAMTLALATPDAETRMRLERVVHDLPPRPGSPRLTERRLPSRSSAWKPTYRLSLDVLRGLSGSLSPGGSEAPGFVVDTWRAWENLLTLAVRSYFGGHLTQSQRSAQLGRTRRSGGSFRAVNVTPDLAVSSSVKKGSGFLLDAKYKGRFERGNATVQPADLYESLAFSRATGQGVVCLVYPRVPDANGPTSTGAVRMLERIEVDEVRVVALDVAVKGLSAPAGLKRFCDGLGSGVVSMIQDGDERVP